MKAVLTYQGLDVVSAIKKILTHQEQEKFPAMVLWDDEPSSYNNLIRFVKSKEHYFHLRFGVACNGNFILDEVYYLLTSLRCRQRNPDQRAHVISKVIRNRNNQFTFFINNCHLIEVDQISWLTGLMIELGLNGRFIYLLHKDQLDKMKRSKDRRPQFFLSRIRTLYGVSHQ